MNMKAKDLIQILESNPESEVIIYADGFGALSLRKVNWFNDLEGVKENCGIVDDGISAPAFVLSPYSRH